MIDLTDRVAIVTGGGRGVGRGIVLALAGHGADVAVADIETDDAQNVAETVAGMGRQSLAVALDVTDGDSIDGLVPSVLGHFGKIDILVNNAGVFAAPGYEGRELSNAADWDWTFEVNLKGVAMVTSAVAPHMKERRQGKIINISSTGGRQGSPVNPAYMASKAGAISLTQSTALELASYNINVNAICPGFVWTPMAVSIEVHTSIVREDMKGLSPREVYDRLVEQTVPLKRDQSPEDVGHLAAFLASDHARNITGQAINICGGVRMN